VQVGGWVGGWFCHAAASSAGPCSFCGVSAPLHCCTAFGPYLLPVAWCSTPLLLPCNCAGSCRLLIGRGKSYPAHSCSPVHPQLTLLTLT
jgi:hypothetical protein